jgi:hypothetical protein
MLSLTKSLKRIVLMIVLLPMLIVFGCSGGSSGGNGAGSPAAITLASIEVTPGNLNIAKGSVQQFTATGKYTDNTTQDLTLQVIWSSSNAGTATISTNGLVTTLSAGTAIITASSGAIVGQANLTSTTWYDAAADFSPTANPNGVWSYGWSSFGSVVFNLFSFSGNSGGSTGGGLDMWWGSPGGLPDIGHNGTLNTWTCCSSVSVPPGQLEFHPGPSGENAIIRWTAPSAGYYTVSAIFTGMDYAGPTTTDVHVLQNGTAIFNGNVSGYSTTGAQSFSTTLNVSAGDATDFVVGIGIDASYLYDTTGVSVTILPAPSILGQVTLNGAGVPGVAMTLSNTMSGSISTDANGNYTFLSLAFGDYTITPTKLGYTFSPPSQVVTVNGNTSLTLPDFSATAFAPVTVSFSSQIQPIFNANCTTGCHSGATPPAGLDLTSGKSFGQIVGVLSVQAAPLLRVKAGDQTNSYLYQKIIGNPALGTKPMPPLANLTQSEIDQIGAWISEGAPNN